MGSGRVHGGLDRAGVDQGAIKAEDAPKGNQVVLETELVRPLEPDPVYDAN